MACRIVRDSSTDEILEVFAENGEPSILYREILKDIGGRTAGLVEHTKRVIPKIKKGVEELFDSNPELANSVYEALGFQGSISLESNLKNTGKTEKELTDYLKNKYPEIKLNISNNPIWEQGDNIFNQNIDDKINNFELFEDQDKLCPTGICNYTAKLSTEYLQKIGLNPYPSNYNGSHLPVKVKSPIGDFNIEHYVSAVAINNAIYIYDMPQNEFISNEFFGRNSDVKVKESYKPRLIPLTLDEIKANYNLSTKEAGNFIHSILNQNGWQGADAVPSFREYIENNIKNPQEYINLLESQIKDSGYEFKQWDVEEYRQEYNNKRQQKKLKKVSKKEEQKVINYYENKLKLKTKEYLPKKTDKFSLKTLINSVIGREFDSNIDFSSFENALQSLENYLKSEKFIEDLLDKVTNAEENLNSVNKSIDKVYTLARLFSSFTKNVKVYGIEEAIKKYDSKQQDTIRTLLPSNVLDKYKSKEQAALLLQKYWGNKDNIVKQLNIYNTKTFTDLVTNRFKAYSVFNKYQTVLNFLKSTDFDSSYLYQAISNEAIRRYSYFDKIGNTQFQKDEFNRIIGQANIKAMTVLIDAVNQKQDTLPHEYAHHYIAWFRNTPIVQEAIKRFGSEEALVQAIGEQVVKQKGEAYNWWKKFTNWILNLLSDKQLLQVLTDSFLNRQDLHDFTYNQPNTQQKQQAQQLYSQYLDTIFPDSKVKDIVYHGGTLDSNDRGKDSFTGELGGKYGIYFTGSKKRAKSYITADKSKKDYISRSKVHSVLLDIKNPLAKKIQNKWKYGIDTIGDKEYEIIKNNNSDGLIEKDFLSIFTQYNTQYVVFEPEQIHILGSKQDVEGFEKYVRRGSANNRAANLEVSEAALIEYFNVLEESMYQDRNSYYRGYLGEPEIDKDGNLILRPTNAEWQKKLSNTGNGISFTSKLSEAERYGELRFEQRSRDIMDTFLSVYDQESELEILEEQGYTIVQINKSLVSSTLEGVEDEARLVTDEPLVIPKGAYKLQRYDSNGPKEPVVVTTLDKNGEPVYVPQQITITEESVVRKELSDLIRDTRENGLLDNNDFNCS